MIPPTVERERRWEANPGSQRCSPARSRRRLEARLSDDAAGLEHATGWLNSPPLTAAELRGKVVLVDFWTYTCINWLRTLPYVRAWAEKYRDRGSS